MKRSLTASDIRTISFLAALIFAIPGLWKGFQGLHVWLSPFLMLNSVLALKSFVWLNIISIPVLVLILIRKRWFCKNICPAGWCFDRISSLSKSGETEYRRFPDLGKWLAIISLITALFGFPLFVILDPLALFNGFFMALTGLPDIRMIIFLLIFPVLMLIHLFFPGIWCRKICPLGGLQTALWDIKIQISGFFQRKGSRIKPEISGRRYFIISGAGLLAGLSIPSFFRSPVEKPIRPPGSVEPVLFNLICCRCGNCVKACPTNIIIPTTDLSQPLSWMTPVIRFGPGYCPETCNVCSKVCPTGAITLFSIEAKPELYMGTAAINIEKCYLTNNRECVKCKESCKYNAIQYIQIDNVLNVSPVVDIQKCVGCGACEVVCPAGCIVVKPIQQAVNSFY